MGLESNNLLIITLTPQTGGGIALLPPFIGFYCNKLKLNLISDAVVGVGVGVGVKICIAFALGIVL